MSKNINVMYSHKSDNWRTPTLIYNHFVVSCGFVDLFPYYSTYDQFEIDYKNQKLYCNPPFSKMDSVVEYLIRQYHRGCDIALLVPARTDTKWFHTLLELSPRIYFIKGRLRYNDSKKVAPFPSIFILLYHDIKKDYGICLQQNVLTFRLV